MHLQKLLVGGGQSSHKLAQRAVVTDDARVVVPQLSRSRAFPLDHLGCDGMLWDAMGMWWDALSSVSTRPSRMRWDDMGCDGIRWDDMGYDGDVVRMV